MCTASSELTGEAKEMAEVWEETSRVEHSSSKEKDTVPLTKATEGYVSLESLEGEDLISARCDDSARRKPFLSRYH